jgi:hypothetical protein
VVDGTPGFTPFCCKIGTCLGSGFSLLAILVPAEAPASWTIAGFPLLKPFFG